MRLSLLLLLPRSSSTLLNHGKSNAQPRRWKSTSASPVTFSRQGELRKLPIPPLEATVEKYLTAISTLSDLTPSDLQNEKRLAEEFLRPGGEGETLQREIALMDEINEETSYVGPFWQDMYMQGRWALPINSNPASLDNGKSFARLEAKRNAKLSQVEKTAMLIRAVLSFHERIERQTLTPDTYKGRPLDMLPYSRMFALNRLPRHERDEWRKTPDSAHVAVFRGGKIFKLDVGDGKGGFVSVGRLTAALEGIKREADETKKNDVTSLMPVLTTLDRATWADVYERKVAPRAAYVLGEIESALFHVAMDEYDYSTRNEAIRQVLHGNGRNRWFDQSFTLITSNDGYTGNSFEHSWGDGLSLVRMGNEVHSAIIEAGETGGKGEGETKTTTTTTAAPFERLVWPEQQLFKDDEELPALLEESSARYQKWIASLRLEARVFKEVGVEEAKRLKASPDGIFQMALQLAHRRFSGKTVSTYESCSTASFLGGRTETIRSATPAASQFVNEALDCLVEDEKARGRLLRAAIENHTKISKEAADGFGFDRHLYVLKRLDEWSGKRSRSPFLFSKGQALLAQNYLSTSTVSNPYVEQSAFGPVFETGFGICYHLLPDAFHFCVTSYRSENEHLAFCNHIERALRDVKRWLEVV